MCFNWLPVFVLLIISCCCNAVEVSKACYGSPGLACTRHSLTCSSGSIAIQDAFYSESTVCGPGGISSCDNINVSSIPDNGRGYNFSVSEMDSLYGNCSTRSTCRVNAGRRTSTGFSTIKYICINVTTDTTRETTAQAIAPASTFTGSSEATRPEQRSTSPSTGGTGIVSSSVSSAELTTAIDVATGTAGTISTHLNDTTDPTLQSDADSHTGTVVGIIIPLCIIIAGVLVAVIILRRRKLRQKGENGKPATPKPKPQEVYSLEKKSSPHYDYATANEYLDSVPDHDNLRSPDYDFADDNHYHQVEPQQTKKVSSEYDGKMDNKLQPPNDSSDGDCTGGTYHELEPQTTTGSSEYRLAGTVAHKNLQSKPTKKGSSEYVLAGNLANQALESQQAKAASSDYEYAAGNTYHKQRAPNGSATDDYAGDDMYHELEPQQTNHSSDYDYAGYSGHQANHNKSSSRNTQTQDNDYDHIGCQPVRSNGHYDTTQSIANAVKGSNNSEGVYTYNHLNDNNTSRNVDADTTYNTTASTRHMDASTKDLEDDYGYNHLGVESRKNVPQNVYDTSASAVREVARMNGELEDSPYDHAHLVTEDSSSSGAVNAGFMESDYDHVSNTANRGRAPVDGSEYDHADVTNQRKASFGKDMVGSDYDYVRQDTEASDASPYEVTWEGGETDVYTLAQDAEANPYHLAK